MYYVAMQHVLQYKFACIWRKRFRSFLLSKTLGHPMSDLEITWCSLLIIISQPLSKSFKTISLAITTSFQRIEYSTFFQTEAVSVLLYGCTTSTLTKRMGKKLDRNYSRMLQVVLKKSSKQHLYNSSFTATYLSSYLSPSKTGKIYSGWLHKLVGWLFVLYGISTLVGCLMPNSVYIYIYIHIQPKISTRILK